MKRWNRGLYAAVFLFLIVLFLLSYVNLSIFEKQERIFNISVIIHEKEDLYWKNVRKGMDQAALDYQTDLNFITLYDDNSTLQQLDRLRREIENGADAVIISPANNAALSKGFDNMGIHIPVVLINSGILSQKVSAVVAPDNFLMGQEILIAAVGEGSKDKVIIIGDLMTRADIAARYEGAISVLKQNNIDYLYAECSDKEAVETCMEEFVKGGESYTMIALEEKYVMWAAELIDKSFVPSSLHLYGIGSNNQIIAYLESGIIRSIAAPDNYDMGYFAVQTAIESVRGIKSHSDIMIDHMIVYPGTIYNKENEKRLFPI